MSDVDISEGAEDDIEQDERRFWRLVRVATIVAIVIVVVLIGAVILSELTATDTTDSFVVEEPVETVDVETIGGHVTIEAAPIEVIEVVRTSHYSIIEPDGAVEVDGMTLILTDGCTRSILLIPNCTVDFEIRVPRNTDVVIDGERTDVTIRGLSGSINVTTKAADIDLVETAGAITVEAEGSDVASSELRGPGAAITTTDGSIALDYVDAPDVVAVTTTVGPVAVVVPQAPYAVDVDAANGDVQVSVIDDPASDRKINVTNSAGNVAVLARP